MDLSKAVAVVGMSCSFPGGEGLDAFWETLRTGTCCMEEIRPDRWNISAFYDPDKDAPGKSYTKHAAFIDHWDMFDNQLFGISEKEAERMDPQQKVTLECVYRALENAGIPLEKISGTDTAVFIGQMTEDMSRMSEMSIAEINSYIGTGISRSIVSNRVSYLFNLHGPSATLDTACSSGLVAVHHGIQSILTGESSAAICGGVNIIISPSLFVVLSKARMSSEKGKCHAFTDQADGYARGEGCGIVVLKSITKAQEDGDRIWGYIATGVNQDGHDVTPMTAPSPQLQQRNMESLYKKMGTNPGQIQYVEAHGTGTKAGDPVEVKAIGEAVGKHHSSDSLCLVGSVKANIGHTESAAGLASLIKVLLMMKNESISPTILHGNINPLIPFDSYNLKVSTRSDNWRGFQLAAINCNGFGGTNAHALVQSPSTQCQVKKSKIKENFFFTFSARSETSLSLSLKNILKGLDSEKIDMASLSFTSTVRRTHHPYRAAYIASNIESLKSQIVSTIKDIDDGERHFGSPKVVFVCVGMGTHWQSMGLKLYKCWTVFADKMNEIADLIHTMVGWSLLDVLLNADLSNPEFGQPAIFAIQVALATLWKSWGISPWGIIGHSVGEVAAAHISGFLPLASATKVICERGRILSKVSGGSMLAVSGIPVDKIKSEVNGRVDIAAVNSPISCTLSGESSDIRDVHDSLSAKYSSGKKLFLRILNVRVAFHSSKLDPVIDELESSLSGISGSKKYEHITIASTVSGKLATDSDYVKPLYWINNTRGTVDFMSGLETVAEQTEKPIIFIELGPKPALGRYIQETLGSKRNDITILPSMKEKNENSTIHKTIIAAYCKQLNFDWLSIWDSPPAPLCHLPEYVFHRKKLFYEPPAINRWRMGEIVSNDENRYLGLHQFLSQEGDEYICEINREKTAFVFDHRRQNKVVVPGAMYADIAIGATVGCHPTADKSYYHLLTIHFERACHISESISAEYLHINLHYEPIEPDITRFYIKANDALLAQGRSFRKKKPHTFPSVPNFRTIWERCTSKFSATEVYQLLEISGFTYGPRMRSITDGVCNESELLCRLKLSNDTKVEGEGMAVHPAILDSVLQLSVKLFPSDELFKGAPVAIHQLCLLSTGMNTAKWIYMERMYRSKSQLEFRAFVLDGDGTVLLHAQRLTIKNLDMELELPPTDLMYDSMWREQPVPLNQVGKDRKVVHFYDNERLRVEIKMHFPNSIDIQSDMHNFDQMGTHLFSDDSFDRVIFYSFAITDHKMVFDSKKIREGIDMVTSNLLAIFKKIASIKKGKRPVTFLLTRDVYRGCHNDNASRFGSKDKIHAYDSLLGASLWGMARCAIREGFPVYLIDGDGSFTPYVNLLASLPSPDYPEWIIADGKYFRNEMLPVLDDFETSLVLKNLQDTDRFALTCEFQNKNLFPKLSIELVECLGKQNEKFSVWLDIQAVHLLISNENVDLNKNTMKTPVSCLDIKGSTGKSEEEYYACCPLKLCSSVMVDLRCLVPCKLLPKTPPILSSWLLAWSLMKRLPKGTSRVHVCTCNEDENEILSSCIKSMGQVFGFTFINESNFAPNGTTSIIYLLPKFQSSGSGFLSTAITSRCKNIHIVGKVGSKLNERNSFPKRSVVHDVVEYFSISNLIKVIPKFTKWLERFSGKIKLTHQFAPPLLLDKETFENIEELNIIHRNDSFIELPRMESLTNAKIKAGSLFRVDSSYVVIGGTQGLGLVTVACMASMNAGYIFVLSRRAPDRKAEAEFSSLMNKHPVIIKWIQADVSDFESLRNAFDLIKSNSRQIRGIFHGAVVLKDGIIQNLDNDMFKVPAIPKIQGTLNLHELSLDLSLDFFVCHSSVSATIGNPGQTGYGAANAFQDAFIRYRRSLGLVGQSIIWGALGVGLAGADEAVKRHIATQGIGFLSKEEIVRCFQHALINRPVGPIYAKLNYSMMIAYLVKEGTPIPLRMSFMNSESASKELTTQSQPSHSKILFSKLDTFEYTLKLVAEQLVMESQELRKLVDNPIIDLGVTSMDGISVQDTIKHDFNIDIQFAPDTTIKAMATEIWDKVSSQITPVEIESTSL